MEQRFREIVNLFSKYTLGYQVHDELLIESHRDCADKVAEILRFEMENAEELAVPLIAEVSVGENWYDNK